MNTRTIAAIVATWTLTATTLLAQTDVPFQAYQAQLAAAEKSIRLGETRELTRWLDATNPDLRGWEWNHLSAIADTTRETRSLDSTASRITASPDQSMIALVKGATVQIRALPDLETTHTIAAHDDSIYRAEFSLDASKVVTVARDMTCRVWNLATGEELARTSLPNPAFAACAFSPDASRVATCAWERDEDRNVHGIVILWDATTGEVVKHQRVGVKPLSAIRFSPDGDRIFTASWDGIIHILDANASELAQIKLPDEGLYNAINDLDLSPDGSLIAVASKDQTARVFSAESHDLIATLRGHLADLEAVRFSSSGNALLTTSADATAARWDTSTWQRTHTYRGATATLRGACWTDNDTSIIACSLDAKLHLWNADADDDAAHVLKVAAEGIYSCAISPDATSIAVAAYNGDLILIDPASGRTIRTWKAHPDSTCHAAQFNATGTRLVTCSWDETARVWNPADATLIAECATGGGVFSTAISPDGTLVATTGADLQIWNVDDKSRRFTLTVDGARASRAGFSHDNARLISGWSDQIARIYDTRSGDLVHQTAPTGASISAVTFLHDSDAFATGDARGTVRVYAAANATPAHVIPTDASGINALTASNDRIAAAGSKLWIIDPTRGGAVLGLKPVPDSIYHAAWSDDGTFLAACAIPGNITVLHR